MRLFSKSVMGYFLWSIPFLFVSCGETPADITVEKPNPADCEWYVNEQIGIKNDTAKLGFYALRFYPDSSYTLCTDLLFEQGRWHFDEGKKLLVLQQSGQNNKRYIKDELLPGNNVEFSFYNAPPQEGSEADEIIPVMSVTNRSAVDPYHASAQDWRKKPMQPESQPEIRKRVISYLNFLKLLYTHAKENYLENAGGTWYPRPIQFYNNKVRMAYNNELVDWYACFYSDKDALEAYSMIAGALQKVKITGGDDNSRNINCVEQLLADLNK